MLNIQEVAVLTNEKFKRIRFNNKHLFIAQNGHFTPDKSRSGLLTFPVKMKKGRLKGNVLCIQKNPAGHRMLIFL